MDSLVAGTIAAYPMIPLMNTIPLLSRVSKLLGLGLCLGLLALRAEPAAQPASARDELIRAIRELRVVTFVYEGHARTMEPHACGVARSGDAVVHGYQTEGGSASGALPGWRTYAIDKISALTATETRFPGARAGYDSDRPKLDPVWAELPPTIRTQATPPPIAP